VRLALLPSDQVTDPALPDFDVLLSVSNPLLVLLQWPVVFPGRRAATDPPVPVTYYKRVPPGHLKKGGPPGWAGYGHGKDKGTHKQKHKGKDH